MMRAAILQTGAVHEEIVPSLASSFGPDWQLSAWLNAKCCATKGDIFAEAPVPNLTVNYPALDGRTAWDRLRDDVIAFRPDVIVAATFQREPLAQFVDAFDLPTLGVIHNLHQAAQAPTITAMIAAGRCQSIVLADHVRATFNRLNSGENIDRIGVVEPLFWGPSGTPDLMRRRIAVPGGVNATNREFDGLLAALSSREIAAKMTASNAVVEVLGGGPDRARLERAVVDQGLSDFVQFAPRGRSGRVEYKEYLAALRQAWALLPLIPLTKADYRDIKITSAIPTALGFGLPMVLDRWTASTYRVPCVTSDVSVAASLHALLDLTDEKHRVLGAAVTQYREAAISRNKAEVSRLLANFGLSAG